MKVTIERDECISCGACYADCPEVFEENDDDYLSQIVEEYRVDGDPAVGDVPEDLRDCATTAAEGCPVEIIHVES
jgi:ferredoxin